MKNTNSQIYFLVFVLNLLTGAGLAHADQTNYTTNYLGLDRNHDGVITRKEWKGNDQSFQNHDWNGDGILSGDELRQGQARYNNSSFSNYDGNGDNVISRNEWRGDRGSFDRMDCNHDSVLTQNEFLSQTECYGAANNGSFRSLDVNNDGYVSRNEWRGGNRAFNNKDCDRDGSVSRTEFFTQNCSSQTCDFNCLFRELDVNNDGHVARNEWRGSSQAFDQLDSNRDNFLTRSEFAYINQNRGGKTQQVLGTVSEVINSFLGQ